MAEVIRKYRYGLANTKYALYDQETGTYGEPKALPGAVSLSLATEGGDASDYYADDGIWATFAGTNGGYSGDLELANIPDYARADLLGEVYDEESGGYIEFTDAEPPEFALITEMTTSRKKMAFKFYNCKASRPELDANTKGETPDVDSESLPLRIGSREMDYGGKTRKAVQHHIDEADVTAAQYAAFFASVLPTSDEDATLSALTIGSLTLTPAFDADTTAYTATTENATNVVTATATDEDATVAITVNGTAHTSGTAATWNAGENAVAVTVTNGSATKTYTVTVTKSE